MMSDAPGESYPPLPCREIVYRALRRSSWKHPETGEILPVAFELKKDEHGTPETGLSVIVSDHVPQEHEVELLRLTTCYGVDSLHVGKIRDLGLDVIQDEPTHAEIRGVPHKDDDPLRAHNLSHALVSLSRKQWRRQRRG